MNDEDKEQIKQIISNNFDQVIDQFLAKKQAEVNKGGSGNQEIHHIDLKSEFETTRQEIYKKLGRSKHTDGVDKLIDILIYNYINHYIYDLAVNNVYSADCLNIDNNYILPVVIDASWDLVYRPIINLESALKGAGFKVERNGGGLLAVENYKNQIILEITQVAENKPDLKITLGDDGMNPNNIKAIATELSNKTDFDEFIRLLKIIKPFM